MKSEQLSLFPDWESTATDLATKNKYLEQKTHNFGLEYCIGATFRGKYGIPLIRSYKDIIPQSYVTFGEMGKMGNGKTCVTFFNHDYVLERFWRAPEKYLPVLATYKFAAEPDFSIKVNTPLAMQIANTYRNHVLAHKMHEYGIHVIPSMSWSTPQSYEFCFDAHERGGVVMISTIGIYNDERSFMYFKRGFSEMLNRISPDSLIVIGEVNEKLTRLIPGQLDVHHFQNDRIIRMRRHGK